MEGNDNLRPQFPSLSTEEIWALLERGIDPERSLRMWLLNLGVRQLPPPEPNPAPPRRSPPADV